MQWLELPATTSLGNLLSQFFLGISTKIAAFISEQRDPFKRVENPSALASLNCIIRIMGSNIDSQAHQVRHDISVLEDNKNTDMHIILGHCHYPNRRGATQYAKGSLYAVENVH